MFGGRCLAAPSDVQTNIVGWWPATYVFPCSALRWVASKQLHSDDAVTNASQLADLLTSANLPVSEPGG